MFENIYENSTTTSIAICFSEAVFDFTNEILTKRTENLELGLNIELTRAVLSTISTSRGKRKVIE